VRVVDVPTSGFGASPESIAVVALSEQDALLLACATVHSAPRVSDGLPQHYGGYQDCGAVHGLGAGW